MVENTGDKDGGKKTENIVKGNFGARRRETLGRLGHKGGAQVLYPKEFQAKDGGEQGLTNEQRRINEFFAQRVDRINSLMRTKKVFKEKYAYSCLRALLEELQKFINAEENRAAFQQVDPKKLEDTYLELEVALQHIDANTMADFYVRKNTPENVVSDAATEDDLFLKFVETLRKLDRQTSEMLMSAVTTDK